MAKSRIEKSPVIFTPDKLAVILNMMNSEGYLMEYFCETDDKGHDVKIDWLVT